MLRSIDEDAGLIAESGLDTERVVERYAHSRIGFSLVKYIEVGLPIFKLRVRAITQAYKPIPPIQEFILRAINVGLDSPDEIGGFLGLDKPIVNGILADLIRSDDVYPMAAGGTKQQKLKLTRKGNTTLEEAELIVKEPRVFEIYFDRLLQIPVPDLGRLLRPKEIREEALMEIPPFRHEPTEVEDLKIQDIEDIVRQSSLRKQDFKRDILRLKDIERRNRLFLHALMLIYKANESDEVQFAFAIDGRLSEPHGEAYARADNQQKREILEGIKTDTPKQIASETIGSKLANLTAPAEEIERLNKQVASAKAEIEEAGKHLETEVEEEQTRNTKKKIETASKRLTQSQTVLNQYPVRLLDVYEHPKLLEKALQESQERLLIVSPWIRAWVVNIDFVRKIENLLKRGVKIFIGYGLGNDRDRKEYDIRAEKGLQELAAKYGNFTLKRLGDTHAKILIQDSKFLVTTSFNWLSFRGDVSRQFRDERGTLVSIPEEIDRLFNEYVQLLKE